MFLSIREFWLARSTLQGSKEQEPKLMRFAGIWPILKWSLAFQRRGTGAGIGTDVGPGVATGSDRVREAAGPGRGIDVADLSPKTENEGERMQPNWKVFPLLEQLHLCDEVYLLAWWCVFGLFQPVQGEGWEEREEKEETVQVLGCSAARIWAHHTFPIQSNARWIST